MGAVKTDLSAKERTLDAKYMALDSADGLRILLSDYHSLINRQYQGDYDACVILIDLATAIAKAGLTDRQRMALRLVYEEDLTQAEAGKRMGLARTTIETYEGHAIDKIAEVYFYWAGHSEGYSVTSTKGETE